MARVHLDLPGKFIFETLLTVRASDVNYGGHVGHDRIVTLMQEARILFYRHLGFTGELGFEGDVGQIITDVSVVYKSESFLGDTLIISIAVREMTKVGFELFYRIANKRTSKEVAIGKTGIVCFDYAKRKVATIPASLMNKLNEG